MNNIYFLAIKDDVDTPRYDYTDSMVIIAKSSKEAREIALTYSHDEGKIWDNPHLVSCKKIGITRLKKGLVLDSFNAG